MAVFDVLCMGEGHCLGHIGRLQANFRREKTREPLGKKGGSPRQGCLQTLRGGAWAGGSVNPAAAVSMIAVAATGDVSGRARALVFYRLVGSPPIRGLKTIIALCVFVNAYRLVINQLLPNVTKFA